MPTELQAPFSLTPSGGIAAVTVPGDMLQQHLRALVSTSPGERVMQPSYGVDLAGYLFSGSADMVRTVISQDVRRAVQQWEPAINVQDVATIVSDTSEGVSAVDVSYSPGAAVTGSTQVSTAVVLVGGEVIG